MTISKDWLDIEYLVFSAHKTATQTIKNSLNLSGIKCLHIHIVDNMDLCKNEFLMYLKSYKEKNSCDLKIISVFRDPMERMISSFFQSLSVNAYAWIIPGQGNCESGDYYMPFDEMQNLFYRYCDTVDGWGESVSDICHELGISADSLNFSERDLIGLNKMEDCI